MRRGRALRNRNTGSENNDSSLKFFAMQSSNRKAKLETKATSVIPAASTVFGVCREGRLRIATNKTKSSLMGARSSKTAAVRPKAGQAAAMLEVETRPSTMSM